MKYGLLALLFVFTMFNLAMASASVESLNIVTANNTEFNTGLPAITVNVTGNCSNYQANFTLNGVNVLTNSVVANNTNTVLTATTSTNAGSYIYNVTFTNETCDAGITNTTANNVMEINARPTISSVSKSNNGVLLFGNTLTWTVVWVDQNSTGTDGVTSYVCKTDAFTASGCTGGQWGNSSVEADNSTTVSYTITATDLAGTKNYYAYVIDNNNYTVASSTSGTFLISRPIEGETYNGSVNPDAESEGSFQWGWIIVALIILGAIYFVFKDN